MNLIIWIQKLKVDYKFVLFGVGISCLNFIYYVERVTVAASWTRETFCNWFYKISQFYNELNLITNTRCLSQQFIIIDFNTGVYLQRYWPRSGEQI